MSEPIKSFAEAPEGTVVLVAKPMVEKGTGREYWWRFFAVVVDVPDRPWNKEKLTGVVLILKINSDLDRDKVAVSLGERTNPKTGDNRPVILTVVAEPWPQGVSASYMKLKLKGII